LGCGGRRFTIYKIRTMTHDCERYTGPRWSVTGDGRATRVGRVLRRLHLDELPQLWNVLRGDMSLVGPRPERPEIAGPLARALPGYGRRLAVRPGLTGLAQVQLPPDEDLAGVARKLALDLDYVRRMGPWLDLRILAATALKLAGVPAGWRVALLALPTPRDGEPAPFRAGIDRVGADVSPQFWTA
jgi:lipopolysaccharide/colanic/teichoic acid biosynthesis glycosyltransferase